jgi:hypothetical protein
MFPSNLPEGLWHAQPIQSIEIECNFVCVSERQTCDVPKEAKPKEGPGDRRKISQHEQARNFITVGNTKNVSQLSRLQHGKAFLFFSSILH